MAEATQQLDEQQHEQDRAGAGALRRAYDAGYADGYEAARREALAGAGVLRDFEDELAVMAVANVQQ